MVEKKPTLPHGLVTAQGLAALVEESYDTIDHWAGMRLLPYQKRGKTRLFSEAASIARCKKIRELQNKDLNLAAIRQMLPIEQ